MTDYTKLAADRYRFSGYNLPMIKLADGFEYYVVGVHPYFFNQPQVFQTPAFSVGFDTVGGRTGPIYFPSAGDSGAKQPEALQNPPFALSPSPSDGVSIDVARALSRKLSRKQDKRNRDIPQLPL